MRDRRTRHCEPGACAVLICNDWFFAVLGYASGVVTREALVLSASSPACTISERGNHGPLTLSALLAHAKIVPAPLAL